LSYQGMLVEAAGPLALYAELKLVFDLPCLAFRAADIYARVVSMREQGGRHFAGLEFTSVDAAVGNKIQLFVQMCIQGEVTETGTSRGT
jgi:adenylate cyclase